MESPTTTLNRTLFYPVWIRLLFISALITGCGINPVTGKTEFRFVSEQEEISIGKENYLPTQQSQGGEYTIDKELTQYVRSVGKKLAKFSDRPKLPYDFTVLNNSIPNAWALPGGKIAVNRGLLLELNNEAELAAVLGHEIVHAAARHGAKSMERGLLLMAGVATLGIINADSKNANAIVGAAALGSNLISNKYGRDAESESDLYGMRYMSKAGYDPRAAVSLQETFVRLSQGRNSNWLEGLFASHPPSNERVKANKKTAKKLKQSGYFGEKEYAAKLAGLKKSQQAYSDFDKGQAALNKKDTKKALTLAQQAIKLEPREALFYSLKADALAASEKFKQAESAYTQAIQRNDKFYYHHLQRGIVRTKQKKLDEAKKDLNNSIKLLPTANAFLNLGIIEEQRGNKQKAIEYYKKAKKSPSDAGSQAFKSLAKLEMRDKPNDYLSVKLVKASSNSVELVLNNPSPLAVKNIVVKASIIGPTGISLGSKTYRHNAILPSGQSAPIGRIALPGDSRQLRIQTKIIKTEIATN